MLGSTSFEELVHLQSRRRQAFFAFPASASASQTSAFYNVCLLTHIVKSAIPSCRARTGPIFKYCTNSIVAAGLLVQNGRT